jgi:hypothetical protein
VTFSNLCEWDVYNYTSRNADISGYNRRKIKVYPWVKLYMKKIKLYATFETLRLSAVIYATV